MSPAGGASRRRSHRDAGSVLDASYPSTAPTYTFKRFKAALAEVRAEIAGLDTRLSMEFSPAFEPEILPGRLR